MFLALGERFSSAATPPVVMVVGAGRGPLVEASIRAATRAGVEIRLFAVEKNPNAVFTCVALARTAESVTSPRRLQYKNKHRWNGSVTVVSMAGSMPTPRSNRSSRIFMP